MPKFYERLRLLRTSRGLSQSDLARYLGISKSSVNMYERGEREPGLETLEAIGDFFNVDMDYLYGRSDIANRYQISQEATSFSDNVNAVSPTPLFNDSIFPHLLRTYRELNADGRQKVYERAAELAELPKYQLNPATDTPQPLPHTAQAIAQQYKHLNLETTESGLPLSPDRPNSNLRVAQDIILPSPKDSDDENKP